MDSKVAMASDRIAMDIDGPAGPQTRASVSARARRSRPARWIIATAIVIAAAIIAGTVLMMSSLRNHVLADSRREVRNLAYMLAEESDRSIQAVELVEKNLLERMQQMKFASEADFRSRMATYDNHLLLRDTISGLPHVETMSLFDTQGRIINYTRVWPAEPLAIADRAFFQKLMADPGLTTILSDPLRNRSVGTWSMYLAHKVFGPDGKVVGAIVGGLELKSFEDLFGALALEKDVEIALLRNDGTLVAHYPHRDAEIGTNIALFSSPAAHEETDAKRTIATHGLLRYPAFIAVSAATATVLADWRTESIYIGGTAVLIVLLIGGIVAITVRQFGGYALLLRARAQQAKAEAARAAAEVVMNEREQAQERLNRQKLQLDAAINNMQQGLVMFNADARLVVCNQRYLEMYGLTHDVATPGRRLRDLIGYRAERGGFADDPDESAARIAAQVRAGKTWNEVVELPDGRSIDILHRPMEDGGWVSTHEDITERRRAERQLQRTEKFLATVIENVPITITVKDARDLRYLLINHAGERYFGLPRTEILGKSAYDLFPEKSADLIVVHDRELLESNGETFFGEHQMVTPAGETRLVVARRLTIRDENGEPQYLMGLIEDVTERRAAEKRIAHIQEHDPLTGLPNRTALAKHLASTIAHAQQEQSQFAVLCIDLDRFSEANDLFGQAIGDALMREVAARLVQASAGAYLAHVGSDEFVLITAEGAQPSTAELACEQLLAAMAEKVEAEGHDMAVTLSIGVALYPSDGIDPTALIGNAGAALYRAKTDGRRTYRFFERQLDQRLRDRRALHHDLVNAIERSELTLHYQPLAKSEGEVIGFEALLRWQHPVRGMVSPAEFIPLAEESGQILALGEWVLREACRKAASWTRPLQVAVNVSPMQFRDSDLVGLVHTVLLETGLPASRLTIEITEGTLVSDFSHAVSILRRLKLLGVQIAMDDFGTGYSSLSYLRSIPFDKIKIDRSFIANLAKDSQAGALVRGIIDLAHRLGLTALAEGVETEEQLALLAEASCNEVQGYFIGRPRPIEYYEQLVGPSADEPDATAVAV